MVNIEGLGWRAFELGDINSSTRHRVMSDMDNAPWLMNAYYQDLPSRQKAAFEAKYAGTWITLSFNDNKSPNGKKVVGFKRAIPELFDWLTQLPDDFHGEAFEHIDRTVSIEDKVNAIKKIEARRQRFYWLSQLRVARVDSHSAPKFKANGGGNAIRVDVRPLEDKLANRYVSDVPMELLLTIKHGMLVYDDELANLKLIVAESLDTSSFERVWLHATMSRQALLLGKRNAV